MVVHLVLLKLKDGLHGDDVRSFAKMMTDVCRQIPSIRAAWVGPREDIDAGYPRSLGDSTYDYAAIVQFDDRDGLLAYLQHPAHATLGARFWEVCDRTVVFEGELVDLKNAQPPSGWSTDQ